MPQNMSWFSDVFLMVHIAQYFTPKRVNYSLGVFFLIVVQYIYAIKFTTLIIFRGWGHSKTGWWSWPCNHIISKLIKFYTYDE